MKLHIKIVLTTIVTLLLLIYLAGFMPIFSKDPTNWVITGRIMAPGPETTASWIPVNNAIVTLTDSEREINVVTTGVDGYYYFSNLAVDANCVITAIAIVNGITMVFKDVIPEAVEEDETYDAGTADAESTALALIVDELIEQGLTYKDIDLKIIQESDNFKIVGEQVLSVLEDSGNVLVDLKKGTTAQIEGTNTITASFIGGGTINPSGAVPVDNDSSQTFTITPDAHYHILGITVDGVLDVGPFGSSYTYTFTNVTNDHTIEAYLVIDNYAITVIIGNNGSISPSGAVTVNHDSSQTFSITPDTNYHIDDVLVKGISVGAISSYAFDNVTEDGHTISATFAIDTYTLTMTTDADGTGSGSVYPAVGVYTYNYGDEVTISATADAISSDFSGWSGDAFGPTDVTLIMDFDQSVIATFNLKRVTLKMAVAEAGSGTVIPAVGEHTYNYGDVVLIKAKPNTGYFASWRSSKADAGSIFTGWSTNENIDNITQANTRVTMNGPQTVTATFTQKETCTLNMSVTGEGSGTVSPDLGEHIYNYEDKVDIKAKAGTDSDFTGWSTNESTNESKNENIDNTTQANTRVTMNGDQTIIANFALKTYILTMKTDGAGVGTVTVVPDKEIYNHGDEVKISATADPTSSDFVRWLHNKNIDKTNKANTKLIMNSDQTVTAIFTKKKTCTLKMLVDGTGSGKTVPSEGGTYTYAYEKKANIKAKADKDSDFTGWDNENIDNTAEANTRVTMNGNQTVIATFTKKETCALTMVVDGTGSGTVSPTADDQGVHTYNYGDKVNIKAKAGKDSVFTCWLPNENINRADATKKNTKVTMNGPQTVTAIFTLKDVTLTMAIAEESTGSGTVSPDEGDRTYDHGDKVKISATADPSSTFTGWSGDASGMGSGNKHKVTLTMDSNKSVTATFTLSVVLNDDAALSVLTPSAGTLVPVFASGTFSYTVVLPYDYETETVPTVAATSTDSNASVEIDQADSVTDKSDKKRTATVEVTAEDGSTELTYEVIFSVAPNTDATLSDLTVDRDTVTDFVYTTLSYNVELPYGTKKVPKVEATPTDSNVISVVITQAGSVTGTATVLITAEDGVATETYTVIFSVAPNDDATLSALTVDGDTVTNFSSSTPTYNVELPYGTAVPTVGATPTDPNVISVVITQAGSVTGTATVLITAEDGVATETYTVTFSVAPNDDATLSNLTVNGSNILDSDLSEYDNVDPGGASPIVEATPTDLNASVVINPAGNVTHASAKQRKATVVVTAEDGITELEYIINFSRYVVIADNTATDITSYNFEAAKNASLTSDVIGTIGSGTVALTVPYGTNVSALVLVVTFELSYGATAEVGTTEQVSGITANDFSGTSPVTVTYTITAQDGTTIQEWDVTVTIAAQ